MAARKPAAPADLVDRGRRFWRDVLKVYELNVDELQLLAEACRTLDECDRLRESIGGQLLIRGSMGQDRLHPAVTELRQARLTLAKLLAQLGLPDVDGEAPSTPASRRATKAATVRWERQRFTESKRQEMRHRGTTT